MWKNLQSIWSHAQFRSVASLFTANSLFFTFWVTRVPIIKDQLDLSEEGLGMMLFFGPIGGLCAKALAQRFADAWGEGRVAIVWTFVALLTSIIPVWAPSPFWLGLGLVAMGFSGGTMGVAINSLVTQLERDSGQQLMITNHGFWSLGGLLGRLQYQHDGRGKSTLWCGIFWACSSSSAFGCCLRRGPAYGIFGRHPRMRPKAKPLYCLPSP